VATQVQARGKARATPQTAPPRMERYMEPGSENACKLRLYLAMWRGDCDGRGEYVQEVCCDIAYYDSVRINVTILLEQTVELLQLNKRFRDSEEGPVLAVRVYILGCVGE
jgi:hypothetical protein